MKNLFGFLLTLIILTPSIYYSQQKSVTSKIIISGKIIEKNNKTPLEYATVTFKNSTNPKQIFGGISDSNGDFSIEIEPGSYDIFFEFISFKPYIINQREFLTNTNFGTINLEEDFNQLEEVTIRAERTTVEIKLDKKVYNVGKDLMVKGGTVSDILDNIPSVTVDIEGNISLRGNENVKVLIDGRPSNAINIAEALRLIPADAIDRVEVITNPSARYDAEGGGGLLNIILKKGKNQGFNGSFIANTAYPETYGLTGTINYKTKHFNIFTTQGLNYRNNPGNAITNSRYLNPNDNTTRDFMNETRDNQRMSKAYNGTFGIDWMFNETTTWTNIVNYRDSYGTNIDNVLQKYYDVGFDYQYTRNRINLENSTSSNIEFTTNFTKKFKKEGHKLTIDGNFSSNLDENIAIIDETNTDDFVPKKDETTNIQEQKRSLIQTDYVLPFGKGNQFEAGYRGDFLENTTDYSVIRDGEVFGDFTNIIEYKERVNALYSQLGFKINKLSTLFGMRWEDSNIDVNQLTPIDYNNKNYNNFFPSAFLTYEISKETSFSLSYSKRIQRPRGRLLNPFNNFSSNVNIFVGNPDLNPAFTDAIDFGYIKRWNNLTFNTSLYANKTNDVFQYVRNESGEENGVPIIIITPINLSTEYRAGFEFTLNYSPYKWWKLNGSFNYFYVETDGDYNFVNSNNVTTNQNFDFKTTSWFTRLTSKVTLPKKIDWQTNMTYNGEQKNAQGSSLAVFSMNIAFSKDVLNDNGTINFNISDVFNSRKRIMESYIPGVVDSNGEMQWRVRQINLSFTYRFNVKKNEKEKRTRGNQQDENGDF